MLTKDEVQHIAELARIGLSGEELEKYTTELSGVLEWVDQLKKVDVEGVPPIAHSTGARNIYREDAVLEFPGKDKIIDLFPEKKERFNKVKSVL